MIGTLIITLAGPHHRRGFQAAQMARLGLNHVFLDAVTPGDMVKHDLDRLRHAWARPMRDVELALTESHRKAWQHVVDTERPHLILEDDAVLTDETTSVLAGLDAMTGCCFVNLETFRKPKLLGRASRMVAGSRSDLVRLYNDRGGAAAYVVWPSAARALLRSTQSVLPPADAATNLVPGVSRHQLVPACAVQAMHLPGAQTEIASLAASFVSGAEKPGYVSRLGWLRCKLRRLAISTRLLGRKLWALPVARARDPGLGTLPPAAGQAER